MIDDTLVFICNHLNDYLRVKMDDTSGSTEYVQLGNIAWKDSESVSTDTNNAFLTLVNIEEDRISKSQENMVRRDRDNLLVYKSPKVYLNLHILFAVNLSSYSESLRRLSLIIQFFQFQNVFTPFNSPDLPQGIEKLILDLKTLSFQDLNNLWGILGSKYLPSAMYMVRLVTISEEFEGGDGPPIREIMVNEKNIG